MNVTLLDPFQTGIPDQRRPVAGESDVTVMGFNRTGTYLAMGESGGAVAVLDVDTRRRALALKGHARPITAVSWSRCGRFLLSVSMDRSVVVWDLSAAVQRHTITLDAPVLWAAGVAGGVESVVACVASGCPLLLDVDRGTTAPLLPHIEPLASPVGARQPASEVCVVACVDADGGVVLASSHGVLYDVDCASLAQRRAPRQVPGRPRPRELSLSPARAQLLLVAHDQRLRLFERDSDASEPAVVFQDHVDRHRWQTACFSADGEKVVAGTRSDGSFTLFVWHRTGELETRISGENVGLLQVLWHPVQPFLATAARTGALTMWETDADACWTAFAPEFQELAQNVEYEEAEDEFDIVNGETSDVRRRRAAAAAQDDDVDVLSRPDVPEPDYVIAAEPSVTAAKRLRAS